MARNYPRFRRGQAQDCGRAARNMAWGSGRARRARRHFPQARPRPRAAVLSGSGETMQAVIAGSVDIGVAAGTLGVMGAYAKGAPIRIIGAESTGEDSYWY